MNVFRHIVGIVGFHEPDLSFLQFPLEQVLRDQLVEFRVEKQGIVHAGVGKASFSEEELLENVTAFVDAIVKAKPSGVKGTYLKKASISSTMGPGVKLDISGLSG